MVPHDLSEREVHEYAAMVEGHSSHERGVVRYFYQMYVEETLRCVEGCRGPDVLEVGCGERLMFKKSPICPIQMDVSLTRLRRAPQHEGRLLCADAYALPFADQSFEVVLLVAVLEHTREPWRILREAHRVLRPGGRVVIVVPNDVTLSLGRALLLKFPARYPDHLTFTTPKRLVGWLRDQFQIMEAFPLPFRSVSFYVNLYYFVVARKIPWGAA